MKQEGSATDASNGCLKEEVGRSKKDKARRKFELKSETKINPKHNLADYL